MSRPFAPRTRVSTYLSAWMPTGDSRVSVAGYFAGGDSGSYFDNIDRIAFPADTKTTLSATLPTAIGAGACFSDSGVAGYVAGGYTGAASSAIQKLTYSGETTSTLGATLTNARYANAGFSNTGTT